MIEAMHWWSAFDPAAEPTLPSHAAFFLSTVESGEVNQKMYMLLTFSDPQTRTDNMTVMILSDL